MERLDKLKEYSSQVEKAIAEVFKNDVEAFFETLDFYIEDEQFELLGGYIREKDYGLAKDATRSLMYLAKDMGLIPLFLQLEEMDEDITAEDYKLLDKRYETMLEAYVELKSVVKE